MKEEKEVLQESGNKKLRLKITYSILILTALIVVELYLMMNYSKNYLFIGIVGLAILCFVYLVTDLVFKLKNENESYHDKDYESVYKAQKVSYVFMKQSFLDVERALDRIREICEVPTEELIQAQKAVGRVTIQRNKENARAVVDSNEKLTEIIQELNHKLQEMIHATEAQDHNLEIMQKQQEVIEILENTNAALRKEISDLGERTELRLNALSDAIKNEIAQNDLTIQEKLRALEETEFEIQKEIEQSENRIMSGIMAEDAVIPQESIISDEVNVLDESVIMEENEVPEEEAVIEKNEISEEAVTGDQMILDESVISEKEMILDEPVVSDEPVISEEESIPEKPAIVEKTISEEPVIPVEDIISEKTAVLDEDIISDEAVVLEEDVISEKVVIPEEPTIEKEMIPEEPVSTKKLKEDKPLESGKMMTPDEIAALLNEMNDEPEIPEPEEESSMPEMSDPGHVMTPEEIAALLANM